MKELKLLFFVSFVSFVVQSFVIDVGRARIVPR